MRLGQAGLKIVGVPFSSGGRKKGFFPFGVFVRKTLSKDFYMAHHMCTTHARMPADAFAEAGRPLQRTTADAKNTQKKAADAFPAFEKYKVIQSNPPCGCPMGCGTLYGGRGFSGLCCCPSGASSR